MKEERGGYWLGGLGWSILGTRISEGKLKMSGLSISQV